MGWPPIRSYRKNSFQPKKTQTEAAGMFVKVSMDGAPYLRKIDLKVYKGYPELLKTLQNMFKFTIGEEKKELFLFLNHLILKWLGRWVLMMITTFGFAFSGEYSEREGYKGSEFVPTYEDKDGDWMLVGDVPWEYVLFFSLFFRICVLSPSSPN